MDVLVAEAKIIKFALQGSSAMSEGDTAGTGCLPPTKVKMWQVGWCWGRHAGWVGG